MRIIILIIISLLPVMAGLNAGSPDVPQALNYQAVLRDNTGHILSNHPVNLRTSILDSSSNGNLIYRETFSVTTNQFGLFTVTLGKGNVVAGNFSNINWGLQDKWLSVEADISGSGNYLLYGNSQLVSVPYALYASKSGTASNVPVSFSPTGDTLFLGNGYTIIPGVSVANQCATNLEDTIPYNVLFPHVSEMPYNMDAYGIPKFILKNYIEIDKIQEISRFRSGAGHDYSDYFEHCRSMKHYFHPKATVDWSAIKEFAPVNGRINNAFPDGAGGTQLWITPLGMPAFMVAMFHVNPNPVLNIGDTIWAGHQIGTHIGTQTESDIAIQVTETNGGWQYISYFDAMSDRLFDCYRSHGILSRDSLIISKADRDADTLHCNGMVFLNSGTINNWVQLR